MIDYVYDDGGRAAAGYKGRTRDCVARAVAIATGVEYMTALQMVATAAKRERPRRGNRRSTPMSGVRKQTTRRVFEQIGWIWVPTMQIGSGCNVHVRRDELPAGRLVLKLSRHVCACIDHVIHDTHDPSREGTRCVYGYWKEK